MESPIEIKKPGENWKVKVWFDQEGKPKVIILRAGSLRYSIGRWYDEEGHTGWSISEETYWNEKVDTLDELIDLIETSGLVELPRKIIKLIIVRLTWDQESEEDLFDQIRSILEEEVE